MSRQRTSCLLLCLLLIVSARGLGAQTLRPRLRFLDEANRPIIAARVVVYGLKAPFSRSFHSYSGLDRFESFDWLGGLRLRSITDAAGQAPLDIDGMQFVVRLDQATINLNIVVALFEQDGTTTLFHRSTFNPCETFKRLKKATTEFRLKTTKRQPLPQAIFQPLIVNGLTVPIDIIESGLNDLRADEKGRIVIPMDFQTGTVRIAHPFIGEGTFNLVASESSVSEVTLGSSDDISWMIEVAGNFESELDIAVISKLKTDHAPEKHAWRMKLAPGERRLLRLAVGQRFKLFFEVDSKGKTVAAEIDSTKRHILLKPTTWKTCTGQFTTPDAEKRPKALQVWRHEREAEAELEWTAAADLNAEGKFSLPHPGGQEEIFLRRESHLGNWHDLPPAWPSQLPQEENGELRLTVSEPDPMAFPRSLLSMTAVDLDSLGLHQVRDEPIRLYDIEGQIRHADGRPASFHPVMHFAGLLDKTGTLVFSDHEGRYAFPGMVSISALRFGYSPTAPTEVLWKGTGISPGSAGKGKHLTIDCTLER